MNKEELLDKLYSLLDDNRKSYNKKCNLSEMSYTLDGDRTYHLGYEQAILDMIKRINEELI